MGTDCLGGTIVRALEFVVMLRAPSSSGGAAQWPWTRCRLATPISGCGPLAAPSSSAYDGLKQLRGCV